MAKRPKLRRGFYWRGSVIWVRTDPVEGKPKSTTFTDPDAAYLWEAERQREAANPVHAAAKKATVGDRVAATIKHKRSRRSGGTLHMYEVKLGHVARIFGVSRRMSDLMPPSGARLVDAYIEQRRSEGAVDNTISRELTCLAQLLKLAKRDGEYEGDIAAVLPVGFSPKYKPTKRVLAREDVGKLLAALRTENERAWVCLAIAIAGDPVDVEAARREDYDPARRVFHVKGTKNDARNAEVPVLDMFRELFDYALPRLPVSWPGASNGVGRACKRAGIPHLSPKDLRRTASSWLMEAGADQPIVSRFMRHTNDTMVRTTYGRVSPVRIGALLEQQTSTEVLQLGPSVRESCTAPAPEELVFCCGPSRIRTEMPEGRGILKAETPRLRRAYTGFRGHKWREPAAAGALEGALFGVVGRTETSQGEP